MMTKEELGAEFWLLTRALLQDGRVDSDEARVVKRWLEEHVPEEGAGMIARLDGFLADGYIDPRESARIAESLGVILRRLRTAWGPRGPFPAARRILTASMGKYKIITLS